jgi:hypothetical protein
MDLLQPKVKSFVVITHNVLDYTSSVEPSRRIMLDLLSYIKDKESEGWQVVPSTLAGVRAAYLA